MDTKAMDAADVMEQARDVIARTFGLAADDVPDAASPETLPAWDSLHHLTLIVALEDQFNVTYTSEEIPHMKSLAGIADVTASHLRVANGV